MLLWEFLLLLPLLAGSSAQDCIDIPGSLKQIDVGIGQVFGVNSAEYIYTLHGDSWAQVPGSLKHVTVGPAGVWGVNNDNNIYKLVGGRWQQVPGKLKQIDVGENMVIAGVNMDDNIFCLSHPATVSVNNASNWFLSWVPVPGSLKYYSCGLWGCWGVNSADDIYFRHNVTSDFCAGSRWEHIPGKLSMIEVGTKGSVYGVNSAGQIYRRDGITKSNPVGTSWTQIPVNSNVKHVSYDLGLLWLITDQDKIVKCRI